MEPPPLPPVGRFRIRVKVFPPGATYDLNAAPRSSILIAKGPNLPLPDLTLRELCQEILKRYRIINPRESLFNIEKSQDDSGSDVYLEDRVGDVFADNEVFRIIQGSSMRDSAAPDARRFSVASQYSTTAEIAWGQSEKRGRQDSDAVESARSDKRQRQLLRPAISVPFDQDHPIPSLEHDSPELRIVKPVASVPEELVIPNSQLNSTQRPEIRTPRRENLDELFALNETSRELAKSASITPNATGLVGIPSQTHVIAAELPNSARHGSVELGENNASVCSSPTLPRLPSPDSSEASKSKESVFSMRPERGTRRLSIAATPKRGLQMSRNASTSTSATTPVLEQEPQLKHVLVTAAPATSRKLHRIARTPSKPLSKPEDIYDDIVDAEMEHSAPFEAEKTRSATPVVSSTGMIPVSTTGISVKRRGVIKEPSQTSSASRPNVREAAKALEEASTPQSVDLINATLRTLPRSHSRTHSPAIVKDQSKQVEPNLPEVSREEQSSKPPASYAPILPPGKQPSPMLPLVQAKLDTVKDTPSTKKSLAFPAALSTIEHSTLNGENESEASMETTSKIVNHINLETVATEPTSVHNRATQPQTSEKQVRPHVCEFCGNAYVNKGHLVRHKRDKPETCGSRRASSTAPYPTGRNLTHKPLKPPGVEGPSSGKRSAPQEVPEVPSQPVEAQASQNPAQAVPKKRIRNRKKHNADTPVHEEPSAVVVETEAPASGGKFTTLNRVQKLNSENPRRNEAKICGIAAPTSVSPVLPKKLLQIKVVPDTDAQVSSTEAKERQLQTVAEAMATEVVDDSIDVHVTQSQEDDLADIHTQIQSEHDQRSESSGKRESAAKKSKAQSGRSRKTLVEAEASPSEGTRSSEADSASKASSSSSSESGVDKSKGKALPTADMGDSSASSTTSEENEAEEAAIPAAIVRSPSRVDPPRQVASQLSSSALQAAASSTPSLKRMLDKTRKEVAAAAESGSPSLARAAQKTAKAITPSLSSAINVQSTQSVKKPSTLGRYIAGIKSGTQHENDSPSSSETESDDDV